MMGLLYMHVTVCGTKARGFQKEFVIGLLSTTSFYPLVKLRRRRKKKIGPHIKFVAEVDAARVSSKHWANSIV